MQRPATRRLRSELAVSACCCAEHDAAHAPHDAPDHGGLASTWSGRWRSGGSCASGPTEAALSAWARTPVSARRSIAARARSGSKRVSDFCWVGPDCVRSDQRSGLQRLGPPPLHRPGPAFF